MARNVFHIGDHVIYAGPSAHANGMRGMVVGVKTASGMVPSVGSTNTYDVRWNRTLRVTSEHPRDLIASITGTWSNYA